MDEERETEPTLFEHKHFYYVFGKRPRKVVRKVDDPVCTDKVELRSRTFQRVYHAGICTYVCQHEEVIAAHKADFQFREKMVSDASELFEGNSTIRNMFFEKADFACVTSTGKLVPLESLLQVTALEVNPDKIYEAARQMAVSVFDEAAKNGIVRQIIERKIGGNFLVTKKPITKRGSNLFSQYSRFQHDVCIQHKTNHFKEGTVRAVVVEPSLMGIAEVEDVEVNEGKEGQVITSIMEMKTGFFARDQIIAQMMCTLTDCAVEVLKEGKQISRAVVYGLSVDYASMNAMIYKMLMDFNDPSFKVFVLQDKVPIEHGLNLLISCISN